MISNTSTTLEKIEGIITAVGYKIRYEKGNFRTAACVLQDSKVVVVNKFSNIEVKIQTLVGLLQEMTIDKSVLEDKQQAFYQKILQAKL